MFYGVLVFILVFPVCEKALLHSAEGSSVCYKAPSNTPKSTMARHFYLGSCSVHNVHTDSPFSSLTRSKKGHRGLSLKYTVALSGSNIPPAVHKVMYYEAGSEISDIPESHP